MIKKNTTSLDYRHLADEIWQKAREKEAEGFHELSDILKDISDKIHEAARKKMQEEEKAESIKNAN